MNLEEAQELIGRNVSAARAKRDLTMKELAQHAGVSTSMISEIENARTWPSVATLIKLAAGLGVSVFDLLADDGPRPQEIAAERERLAQQLVRLEQVITSAAARVEELTQTTMHLQAALLDQQQESRGAHIRAHKAEQERDAARVEVERLSVLVRGAAERDQLQARANDLIAEYDAKANRMEAEARSLREILAVPWRGAPTADGRIPGWPRIWRPVDREGLPCPWPEAA